MGAHAMTPRRLLETWEPPSGYRLASILATTYELDADFLEEDLLPTAFGLQLAPARGREFRLELEHALQDAEVSIFFHPDRYRPGLRRSPRIDLLALPEGRYPKLHAKVALLRFVTPDAPAPERQIVRLLVGSANLTGSGYRSNIEVAASIEHRPGGSAETAATVRDAVDWLEDLIDQPDGQVARQIRDIKAALPTHSGQRRRRVIRFVGLPREEGFPSLAHSRDRLNCLTVVSPFWPSGDDLSDVAAALKRFCGGRWKTVKLIGPSDVDEHGKVRPAIPAALVRALLDEGAAVEVAAADPSYGCSLPADEDDSEFDRVAERRGGCSDANRSLHAKALLAVGTRATRLAIGSFNLTRKGLGLAHGGNAEAGLLWTLPNEASFDLKGIESIGTAWRKVTSRPEEYVVEPADRDGGGVGSWPDFILSLRAKRAELVVEGDADRWPDKVVIRMRDIRSRLTETEQWFDPWTVHAPDCATAVFFTGTELTASWLDDRDAGDVQGWPALPDLEAEVSWEGECVAVPVIFEEKHLFPIVETQAREDEQSLVAWFLGLRPSDEADAEGFGHSIDPIPVSDPTDTVPDTDILSYLVRDFVHALPGVRNRLVDGGMTETGLRGALLGPRSPVALAREALRAYRDPQTGRARKTAIATSFQVAELQHLLQTVPLPELPDGISCSLRREALAEISAVLGELTAELSLTDRTKVVCAYLGVELPR